MGGTFDDAQDIGSVQYLCGWCSRQVAASRGWMGENDDYEWGYPYSPRYLVIALCPNCKNPSFIVGDRRFPGGLVGDPVEHLPADVERLYKEARSTAGNGDYTAAVLTARKLLMHVAVEKGADEDQSFRYYVDWLAEQGIVTADMKGWVDEIRELGNDANHEIQLMEAEEATELLTFVAMLLRVVYEFPERGQRSIAARQRRDRESSDSSSDEAEASSPPEGPPPTLGG